MKNKHHTKFALLVLIIIFLFVALVACAIDTRTVASDYNDEQVSEANLTVDDYLHALIKFAAYHGHDFSDMDIDVDPSALDQFPTLDEWLAHLEEMMLPLWNNWATMTSEMNQFGYEPLHDVTVVTFTGDVPIAVYLELEQLDLNNRSAHPVRIGNHDHVLLPLEPILDKMDISFIWDDESGLLHIEGLTINVILEPGRSGFALNVLDIDPIWNYFTHFDSIVLLERKDTGLYAHSSLFTYLRVEYYHPDFPDFPIQNELVRPLIYHDLNKVVLVTHDRTHYPNYNNKYHAMRYQFNRADFPISYISSVFVIRYSFDFSPPEETVLVFESGQPYLVTAKYRDYVMLPAIETFELLGIDIVFDAVSGDMSVNINGNEYIITANAPLFPQEYMGWQTWQLGHIHEVTPIIVDDVLFISHSDLARILMFSGFMFHINRPDSQLEINIWPTNNMGFCDGFTTHHMELQTLYNHTEQHTPYVIATTLEDVRAIIEMQDGTIPVTNIYVPEIRSGQANGIIITEQCLYEALAVLNEKYNRFSYAIPNMVTPSVRFSPEPTSEQLVDMIIRRLVYDVIQTAMELGYMEESRSLNLSDEEFNRVLDELNYQYSLHSDCGRTLHECAYVRASMSLHCSKFPTDDCMREVAQRLFGSEN